MKRIFYIIELVLILYGCASSDGIKVNQISSKYPIILIKGIGTDKISAVRIPLAFQISKSSFQNIEFTHGGYWHNSDLQKENYWEAGAALYYIDNDSLKRSKKAQKITFHKITYVLYTSHRLNHIKSDSLQCFFQPYIDRMTKEGKDTLHIGSIEEFDNTNPNIIADFLLGDSIGFLLYNGEKSSRYTYPVKVKTR